MVNIHDIHDKIYVFQPADDAPGFFKCFFNVLICSPLGHSTLLQKVEEKDGKLDVYGTDAKLCNGCAPQSPCLCTVCCGFGPCGAEWHFEPVEGEPNKYTAHSSVFKGGCCESMTNHNGDWFVYDEDHDGSFEKPMLMTAGKNPMNPPCFAGMQLLKFYEVKDRKGTAVEAKEMAR